MDDDKGYTVRDKRKVQDGREPDQAADDGESRQSDGEEWENMPLSNDLGFSTFIISLSTSALVHLAELPDPVSNEKKVNLPLARQTIAIIEMLKAKTKGNLSEEEERLIDDVLYELRVKFVQAAG